MPTVTICPPHYDASLEFDLWSHYRSHHRTSAEAGVAYSDYKGKMHSFRTSQPGGRRRGAEWANNDLMLKNVILLNLEHRLQVPPLPDAPVAERLARLEKMAHLRAATARGRLSKYALRAKREKNPCRAGSNTIQFLNRDTLVNMTQTGVAKILAVCAFMYFRCGWRSPDVAEIFNLRHDHVRQLLFRLTKTWRVFFADNGQPHKAIAARAAQKSESHRGQRYKTRADRILPLS